MSIKIDYKLGVTIKSLLKKDDFRKRLHDRNLRKAYYHKHLYSSTLQLKKNLLRSPKQIRELTSRQVINQLISDSSKLANTSWEYIKSFYDFSYLDNENILNRHRDIIEHVAHQKQLDPIHYEQAEIFNAIFTELKLYSIDPHRTQKIRAHQIDTTIVLISGVFNEFFHKADFERGVSEFAKKYNCNYFIPKISGVKSSLHNTQQLKQQLEDYIQNHPNEKLWMICFSKGGIDLLHFLKKNHSFARKHIIGVSMLAVPILGTAHLEKKRIKILNLIQKIPHKKTQELLNKYGLLLSPEFQVALDKNYREPWFKRNYQNLPENLFYTALAFSSSWREGHAWMKLTKIALNSNEPNDGIVESARALFPEYFFGINLGIQKGHHLVGNASSAYPQEELIEAHIIYLQYLGIL